MTDQLKIFEVPEVEKVKPLPGMRCRNCIHCYEHQYNKQKGTSYGDKKIKALDPACPMFKKIEK